MWSKISSALKPREGNDSDTDHSDARSQPDPFRVNATTYYTHQAPSTPPHGTHSRTASREEDLIWSLRTQLALQRELCAQFEIDLSARDELVEALTDRFQALEKENDKRKSIVRSWKKKAADLEKMCRHLEEEVDNSRRESMERSIMDEASGEALRQLHRQISQLEREKNEAEMERDSLAETVKHSGDEIVRLKEELLIRDDVEMERDSLAQTVKRSGDEIVRLKEELDRRENVEAERDSCSSEISQLRTQVQQLQKDSAIMEMTIVQLNKQLDQDKEDIDGLNIALESKQQELELVKRKHGARGTTGPTPGQTNMAINTRPHNALRRVSSSSMESKTKPPNRRASIAFRPNEADEKENVSTVVPLKHPRRTLGLPTQRLPQGG